MGLGSNSSFGMCVLYDLYAEVLHFSAFHCTYKYKGLFLAF